MADTWLDRDTRIDGYFRFRAELEREQPPLFMVFLRALGIAFLSCGGLWAAGLLLKAAVYAKPDMLDMDVFGYTMAAILLVNLSITAIANVWASKEDLED